MVYINVKINIFLLHQDFPDHKNFSRGVKKSLSPAGILEFMFLGHKMLYLYFYIFRLKNRLIDFHKIG